MPAEQSTEDRLIETLFARHSAGSEGVLVGPGDDAAMLHCPDGEELLITTDMLNEGVHFPRGTPAHAIGHRALAVSLSDLAAMGARPLWAVVALSFPAEDEWPEGHGEEEWEQWLAQFARGLYALADAHGVRIVGGDFVRGPVSVTVTAHGSVSKEAAIFRAGAGNGDGLWVSGTLGDAAAGLEIIERRLNPRKFPENDMGPTRNPLRPSAANALVRRFCYPQPRIELGCELRGIASACMDLSDGLMTDLPRLLRGKPLQASIETERLPISSALRGYDDEHETALLAMAGGDDYELCFTVPAESEYRLEAVAETYELTRIGRLHTGEGVTVTQWGKPWAPRIYGGFRHFS